MWLISNAELPFKEKIKLIKKFIDNDIVKSFWKNLDIKKLKITIRSIPVIMVKFGNVSLTMTCFDAMKKIGFKVHE